MKLRRRREEKQSRTVITCSVIFCQVAARTSTSAHAPIPSSTTTSILPPSTQPHQPAATTAPACRPPRVGRAIFSSYLRPSCPASPFFLHKITEAEEREGKDRGGAPTLPTQLSYLTITRRIQLARHPCSFIQSGGRGFTPVLMASSLWRAKP